MVPVFVSATPATVSVPVPADLRSVPTLANVLGSWLLSHCKVRSPCASHTAPASLVTVLVPDRMKRPPVHTTVPRLRSSAPVSQWSFPDPIVSVCPAATSNPPVNVAKPLVHVADAPRDRKRVV